MSKPVYVVENDIRRVLPYYQLFTTHIKTRWEGRTVADVFCNELGQSPHVVEQEIRNHKLFIESGHGSRHGPVKVQGWASLHARHIQKHDMIHNLRHMHEPAVLVDRSIGPNTNETSLNIVYKDENYLVVNKPAGIPVHPTSNYRYNSVSEMLKHDLNLENVWLAYRLDQVTSGVLIFGLNKHSASQIGSQIQEKSGVTKTYVARVQGRFPDTKKYTEPVFLVNSHGGYLMPLNCHQLPTDSTTIFKRVKYNEKLGHSVVECVPLSGKMHQIRIHLRNLGFPIVNDWVYNNTGQIQLSPLNELKNEVELDIYRLVHESASNTSSEFVDVKSVAGAKEVAAKLDSLKQFAKTQLHKKATGACAECGRTLFEESHNGGIYLHALKYEFKKGLEGANVTAFETPVPEWCNI